MEYRKDLSFCEGWETVLGTGDQEPLETAKAHTGWKNVRIPHNWDQYEGYHRVSHGNLHGTAWYRNRLETRPEWEGKQVFLFFEGVGSYADIWVNGNYAGGHKGGRTCFQTEITEFLRKTGYNEVWVRARHPEKIDDLPWICGGCYGTPNSEGSQPLGIFRPVHIRVTGEVSVKPFGVYITTSGLSGEQSDVRTETELVNHTDSRQDILLRQELADQDGKTLGVWEASVTLAAKEERTLVQTMPGIGPVCRWCPETPVLYRIKTTVLKSGKQTDYVENSFGFREIVWENFENHGQPVIDQERLSEEPSEQNHYFVSYLKGKPEALVAIPDGGVKIFIRDFTPEKAVIVLRTTLRNNDEKEHTVQLESFVQTYNRTKSIANLTEKISLGPHEEKIVEQRTEPLLFPDLWTRENPFLHNVISTLRGVDEALREYCQTSTSFAISEKPGIANKGNAFVREGDLRGKQKKRFMLNGRHYFLNGSCEYEHELGNDHAFSEEMVKTRMEMFRSAGFNAFREAHCPHNLRYLQFCEEQGIFYWAQMGAHIYFDTEAFRKNFLALTEEWLRERRNSPAIILWSIQNESMLPADFTRTVTERIHGMDVSSPAQRKVVTCNGGIGSDWNIPQNWSGTYGGSVENYGREAVDMQLVGEYGQYRVKGKHREGDMEALQNTGGDVSEELFCYCLETKVREAEKVREFFYGHFQWIFATHANPGRELLYCLDGAGNGRVGVVNNKGLFTSWGEPTDAYYMYRANYVSASEAPMVYIVSHSWPDRFEKPETVDISVYSNCDTVELYNDYGEQKIGTVSRGKTGEHFLFRNVPVQYGVLTAKGYVNGRCAVRDRVFYPALPLPKKEDGAERGLSLGACGDDLYRVNCGGGRYLDSEGYAWEEDRAWHPSGWGWKSWGMSFADVEDEIGSMARVYDEIENTADPELFQTFRYGRDQLEYNFPVKDGSYLLNLYFAEPWYGNAGENAAGWRQFDVAVNGKIVLPKMDIWTEAGGTRRAIRKQIPVQAGNGAIRISFPYVYSNQVILNGLRISPDPNGED